MTLDEFLTFTANVFNGLARVRRDEGNLAGVVECERSADFASAAATRLRDEIRAAESERHEHADARHDLELLTRINGGSSPPVTPGSPGGVPFNDKCGPGYDGPRHYVCTDCAPEREFRTMEAAAKHWTGVHGAASALPVGVDGGKVPDSESLPATPPTTPTCASWCGTKAWQASDDGWFRAGARFDKGGKAPSYCTPMCRDMGRSLHPRTP